MTARKQLDFKSENLFLTCSVTTSLVTSVKFNPIHCATMFCLFGRERNGSVATFFIPLSRTVTNSAKGRYVVVPEHFAQIEELARRKEKRSKSKSQFNPKIKSYLFNAANS